MLNLLIPVIAIFGGMVQAITGFGSGIVMMMLLPFLFSMNVAPAISGCICTPLPYSIVWRYRKWVNLKKIALPAACYITFSTIAIQIGKQINMNSLKPLFGAFLIVLSIYFTFFSKKIKLKGSLLSAVLCGSFSGIFSGFFGIGGPLMTLYFLAVTEAKEEYMASANTLFLITTTYQTIFRIASGILTVTYMPYIAAGIAGILLGRFIGSRILDRLNAEQMKKIIYAFLAFAGIMTIINS